MNFFIVDEKSKDGSTTLIFCPEEELKQKISEQQQNQFISPENYWSYNPVKDLENDINDQSIRRVRFSNVILDTKQIHELSILANTNFDTLSFNDVEGLIDLPAFKNVRHLSLGGNTKLAIDLSLLQNLEVIEFLSHNAFKGSVSGITESLKKMVLWYFNPKGKDIENIAFAPNLEELIINHTNIESVKGIGDFTKLSFLSISYGTKLSSLAGIDECPNLKKVFFESCKKITNWKILENNQKLNSVSLINCGTVSGISKASMSHIENFITVKTKLVE